MLDKILLTLPSVINHSMRYPKNTGMLLSGLITVGLTLVNACSAPKPKADASSAVRALRAEHYHRAVQKLTVLMDAYPDSLRWLRLRGFAYDKLGNYQAGIDDFSRLLSYEPDNVVTLNNRGFAFYQSGKISEAVTDFNQALKLNPSFVAARSNRALALVALERFPQALADTECAIRLGETGNSTVWNLQGFCLLQLAQPEAAMQAFDRAIKLDSCYRDARNNRDEASKALKKNP